MCVYTCVLAYVYAISVCVCMCVYICVTMLEEQENEGDLWPLPAGCLVPSPSQS